jgi:hypothetical protein
VERLEEYSEKYGNKEETLKVFIGKRQSHPIRIETYDFEHMSKEQENAENSNNTSNSGSAKIVPNAMTMQTALETAYNDWNKEKTSGGNEVSRNQEDDEMKEEATKTDNNVKDEIKRNDNKK